MIRLLWRCRAACAFVALLPAPWNAGAARALPAPLRVALTCLNTYCDPDFQRTELPYVAFVLDLADADVQTLVSSDANGTGGRTYTVRVIGRSRFDGKSDTYTIPLAADATQDDQRRALSRVLAAALVPYLAQTGGLDGVTIAARVGLAPTTSAAAVPVSDPWNGWVFSATLSGTFNGNANSQNHNGRSYGSASRVTDARILRLSFNGNRSLSRFRVDSATVVRNEQTSLYTSALAAQSVGPKTTVGGAVIARTSTFDNTDLSVGANVGIERSLYPYSQSTSRLVTLRYNVGASRVAYRDTTVYDRIAEVLVTQSARLAIDLRQPWGTVGLFTLANHHLNHPDQYSVTQAASVDVRLFKGFSVGFYGGADLIRNQRQIPRRSASRDDVLLQRRALQSNYSYFGGVGMRYTFGSALAGVVNNRFRDGYSLSFSY